MRHGIKEHVHGAQYPAVVGSQRRIVQPPPSKVVEVPARYRQVLGQLHPMPLRLEIAVHGRTLVARVAPEADGPSKEAYGHEDQRNRDPLRHGAFGGPQECDQGERRRASVGGVVEVEGAVSHVGQRAVLHLPPPPRLVAC